MSPTFASLYIVFLNSTFFILVRNLVYPILFVFAVLYPDEEFVNQIRKLE